MYYRDMDKDELKKALEEKGVKPFKAASEIGVSPVTMYRWLSGKSKMGKLGQIATFKYFNK